MRIGITENGDASLDYTWLDKEPEMNMMILITKNITDKFIRTVLPFAHKTIIHATCTGYGGTKLEPNVPKYTEQLDQVRKLIAFGFPAQQIVVRIDPIIPTTKGLRCVENIVEYIQPDITRFRISVLDNYPHVKERFRDLHMPVLYNGQFQASDEQFAELDKTLCRLAFRFNVQFESCAEPKLTHAAPIGCVNQQDVAMLGLTLDGGRPKKQREGCLCIAGKTEMLPYRHFAFCAYDETAITPNTVCSIGECKTCRHYRIYGCSNRCAYCYWKT